MTGMKGIPVHHSIRKGEYKRGGLKVSLKRAHNFINWKILTAHIPHGHGKEKKSLKIQKNMHKQRKKLYKNG